MIKANFFWHGASLSLYERACVSSFVRDGIDVRLHSFNLDLAAPEGVTLVDARALARPDEVERFTHDGQKGSIAAFTDIFRLRMLARDPGWWFDTDVFCLKGATEFAELEASSPGLLLGQEEPGKVNNAVMFFSDTRVAEELLNRAEAHAAACGDVLAWGALGPDLLTAYLKQHPQRVRALPESYFYPIHYLDAAMFFLPEDAEQCRQRASGAVCVHLWNEFLRRWSVPKNILPCEGSYLHQRFFESGVTVEPNAALPAASFAALRHNGEIGRVGTRALKLIKGAKRLKETVVGR